MRQRIEKLRAKGLTYQQIADIVGLAKSTISYHLSEEQRIKTKNRMSKWRNKQHPYITKIEHFQRYTKSKTHKPNMMLTYRHLIRSKIKTFCRNLKTMKEHITFTVDDVIQKFGENPVCYLTGEPIDITKPRSYNFDHIIPRSKGGKNTLDNLGICTYQANQSKSTMTPDELFQLCKNILEHQGYTIKK